MKKVLKFLLVVVFCVLVAFLILFKYDQIRWNAKYIWLNPKDKENTVGIIENEWVCFRKKINISSEKDLDDVIAKIAVDTKYWLYINDKVVIREGGLKRGEKVNSIYYDEIDITQYLQKGENTIAVMVSFFGADGYSHANTSKGCLFFQTIIGKETIISDSTWKIMENPAYLKSGPLNNDRLSEPNIYYNANLEIEDWYKKDFDDSDWKNATEIGEAGDIPWGKLIKRDIPQFKFSEIKEYENFYQYKNYITTTNEVLTLELPYNMQLTPYLKIEAPANLKIDISNVDRLEEGTPQTCKYITKNGIQEFEMLEWISGEKIYYYFPEGVKIISLGYRQTGYDTEMSGEFICDDEILNELWDMANKTLYVNMRDNYMDCPDRERALWAADTSVSMEQAMYGLDTNANSLYENAIKRIIGWREENLLMTVVPTNKIKMHLPVQMLISIPSMYNYYEYTGKKEFLIYIYPYLIEYLKNWEIDEYGLVTCTNLNYIWLWGDSAGEIDYRAVENISYYYALNSVRDMAEELGYWKDAKILQKTIDNLYDVLNEKLWKEDGYKEYNLKTYDVRANAIAVLSGLADSNKYETISKILIENKDNSPLMEKYILEALCKMNKYEDAEKRIKERYTIMVEKKEDYSSTLWEFFKIDAGSKNHAWSGSPLIIMSKYFAGVEPLIPGYEEISIKPHLLNLNSIKSKTNTVKGTINLEVNKENEKLILKIRVPSKTLVAVEKMKDNPEIKINGEEVEFYSEDENYRYFYVEKGKYEIISK